MELRHWNQEFVLAVYIFTFVTGLPANILAFYAFSRKVRQKPTPIDILLLNLTVSDLIFLIFLPIRMVEASEGFVWNMPYFLCPLSGFIFYSTIYNSTFFLTAVSVERYLGVAFPIKYKLKRHPLYAVIASIIFWLVSMSHCSVVYIMHYFYGRNDINPVPRNVCYMNFTEAQLNVLMPVRLELFLVLFCIPFIITCLCYINLIRILSRLPHISAQRRHRAIGLALGTLLVFTLCFGPYNVSHVVGFVKWESPNWRVQALLFSTFNACLDPIIFYFSSSTVRKILSQFFKHLMERPQLTCCHKVLSLPQWSCTATEETTQSSNETT